MNANFYISQSVSHFLTFQNSTSEWLTANEAAEYLKIKPRTLQLWAREGKVRGYPLSGTKRHIWRFRRQDLDSTLLSKPMLSCSTPAVLKEGRLM